MYIECKPSLLNHSKNLDRFNNSALHSRRFLTIEGVPMLLIYFLGPW